MTVKFKNKIHYNKINEFINSGVKHPILLEEKASLENGNEKSENANFFLSILFEQKEFAAMLKKYYSDPEFYEMFLRCEVYNEDYFKQIIGSFRNKNIIEYFKHNNSYEPFAIINNGYDTFKVSYTKVFTIYKAKKGYSEIVFNELQKLDIDDKVIFAEMKRSGNESLAALFVLCENKSEEEISLYIERFLNICSQHETASVYFSVFKKFSILLLNEKIAPGIYDKYRLLFN